jgi:hypothetical protein
MMRCKSYDEETVTDKCLLKIPYNIIGPVLGLGHRVKVDRVAHLYTNLASNTRLE